MQIFGAQEFPHFQSGEPENMNYEYTMLGTLVRFCKLLVQNLAPSHWGSQCFLISAKLVKMAL